MNTITIGVDLAKSVFSVCAVNATGRVQARQEFKRDAFGLWLAQVPAGTVVAMEACSGAHHWARRCLDHGLQPRIMEAQFVKPFRSDSPSARSGSNGSDPPGENLTDNLAVQTCSG